VADSAVETSWVFSHEDEVAAQDHTQLRCIKRRSSLSFYLSAKFSQPKWILELLIHELSFVTLLLFFLSMRCA